MNEAGIVQVTVTGKLAVFVILGSGQIPGELTDAIWSARDCENQIIVLGTVIVKEYIVQYGKNDEIDFISFTFITELPT